VGGYSPEVGCKTEPAGCGVESESGGSFNVVGEGKRVEGAAGREFEGFAVLVEFVVAV